MSKQTAAEVADAPEARRYEAHVAGQLAGFAQYRIEDSLITFTHTEVLDRFESRGVGGQLARTALDDARSRGLRVRPACSFIRSWIERHPDYGDLVA